MEQEQVAVELKITFQTAKAFKCVLVEHAERIEEPLFDCFYWLPKSQVKVEESSNGMSLFTMPSWLARKNCLETLPLVEEEEQQKPVYPPHSEFMREVWKVAKARNGGQSKGSKRFLSDAMKYVHRMVKLNMFDMLRQM